MAVKAPTAPVPPVPPSVPGVTMQQGGTAQESNVPRDKQQTNDQRLEDQARQAVARGDGALSKTTQTRPEKEAKKEKAVDASGGASQAGQTAIVPAKNGLQEENPQQQALADARAAQAGTQAQEQQADNGWAQFASHGAAFWGAVLVFMALVVWFGIRKLMARKDGRKGALSFADIDGAANPVRLPGKTAAPSRPAREGEEVIRGFRGMTPDEALAQMAREEEEAAREEVRQARAEARERLQKAGRLPINTHAPNVAARQYREQVAAELPKEKVKPLKPQRKPKEEEQRFEVRI